MKKLLLVAMLTFVCGGAIAAEPEKSEKIVVVDMQKLLESSTAASSIKEQAKKERDSYQASVSKEEEQLRKEEAKLSEQRSILTQEAFAEKGRQFKDKVAKVQRDFQEKRAIQEQRLKQSLDQVNQVIFEIIDNLAQEQGFDIAVPTSQILYATKKLDITDKVLERLNQKLPQLAEKEEAKPEEKKETDTKKKKK